MKASPTTLTPRAAKELLTFVVAAVCLALTVYLGATAPAEKRAADYLAHALFSTLFALPTGAAWRSFREA
jgi:hypothetical protein